MIEYLNEIKTEFENTLACYKAVYQGTRWVQIMKKTGGRKSCDTLPLKQMLSMYLKSHLSRWGKICHDIAPSSHTYVHLKMFFF